MVASPNEYRWDFLGLSTDTKPTPETSENVTNGSTYYEVNTSKLYVYYGTQWYEKASTGGGSSDFETLELTIDYEAGTVSTVKTVREIVELYSQGKCFSSVLVLDPDPQSLICLQLHYGTLIYFGEDGYGLAGFTHSPEEIVRLDFAAPEDLDAVFTAAIPS